MTKHQQSEADFNASLAERLRATGRTAAPMHMNDLPSGPSKSLSDLLNDNQEQQPQSSSDVPAHVPADDEISSASPQRVPLHMIVDSPYQPRKKYDESELQLLGETLKGRGQDEPITVRVLDSGKFELIAGHRRVRAARLIGWSELDARVVTLSNRDACLATLVHNESNVKLSDYERGLAYQTALKEGYASTQSGIATVFGCTQARVSQCLSLFDLPQPVLDLMAKYPELITYRKARVIKEVLARHPSGEDSIVRAVETLIDRPHMDQSELRAVLLKPFEAKRVRSKAPVPRTINDKNGESAFHVQVKSRDILIQVEDGVDVEMALQSAMAALREFAVTLELPKKQKSSKSNS
ncbi:ParB/RepB/Spo0J family partition protein [Massilia sp. H6]|uniref:ParB/RepB/Spo0J family partition protein n=1 Tax=Massilia sp. H6 TaxID=2970464 RepID=UPI002167512E|nr:ParB/RepB/Spo0J family partition protein [Massilia sp. H6]UVW30674.1 ParB/RepB/Spo0J family partition protein [Massilia sp. H6]